MLGHFSCRDWRWNERGRRPRVRAGAQASQIWLHLAMTFDPPFAHGLSGAESFEGLDASVGDFWRFAMSNLRTNNVRGYLAESLVARAIGSTGVRVEWDPWDVTAPGRDQNRGQVVWISTIVLPEETQHSDLSSGCSH